MNFEDMSTTCCARQYCCKLKADRRPRTDARFQAGHEHPCLQPPACCCGVCLTLPPAHHPCIQFGINKFTQMTTAQRAKHIGLKRRTIRVATASAEPDIVAMLNATAQARTQTPLCWHHCGICCPACCAHERCGAFSCWQQSTLSHSKSAHNCCHP